VFFGRQEVRKGFLLFLDALDALVGQVRGGDLDVTVLGRPTTIDGVPSGDLLAERARRWPWPVRVLDDLDQPEALAYLTGGDRVAVLPSLADNLPLAVLEVVALGVPFLTCPTGGIPELIDPRDPRAGRRRAGARGARRGDGPRAGRPAAARAVRRPGRGEPARARGLARGGRAGPRARAGGGRRRRRRTRCSSPTGTSPSADAEADLTAAARRAGAAAVAPAVATADGDAVLVPLAGPPAGRRDRRRVHRGERARAPRPAPAGAAPDVPALLAGLALAGHTVLAHPEPLVAERPDAAAARPALATATDLETAPAGAGTPAAAALPPTAPRRRPRSPTCPRSPTTCASASATCRAALGRADTRVVSRTASCRRPGATRPACARRSARHARRSTSTSSASRPSATAAPSGSRCASPRSSPGSAPAPDPPARGRVSSCACHAPTGRHGCRIRV
jgi:hypothetical protein